MALKPLDPYRRAPQPSFPGSERMWLNEELRKLEQVIAALIETIKELRDTKADKP